MVEVKKQYPFVDDNGQIRNTLIKHWAEDENGVRYIMRQVETGAEYGEAVDVFPCRYTYVPTDKKDGEEEVETPTDEQVEEN